MATYKIRGTSHNVIYTYCTEDGIRKQQWETYSTELEAIQRKTCIDFLQKNRRADEVRAAVIDYREKHTPAKALYATEPTMGDTPEDNTHRTYAEFIERFLPVYARKRRFSPNTYDSYTSNLKNHILPYFGNCVMSRITAEEIDNFIDFLSNKPCKGSRSHGKSTAKRPKLSSATIKKCYNILMVGFATAKKWHYVNEIPQTTAPAEKTRKRSFWAPERVFEFMSQAEDDPILHLAVHLAFVCSLRAGEVVGIAADTVDFRDRSMWITQIVQRVSDESIKKLPPEVILKVFPKKLAHSSSSLILKDPKTEGSRRKQYLTTPLLKEIRARLDTIRENKELLGPEYQDHGLLICQPDGTPIDPKSLDKAFKARQTALNMTDQIEFQGLRKSGQMHKVRLSQNNYQLVAQSAGQSPEVLMSNYNEALESEKRTLSLLVETNFYPGGATPPAAPTQAPLQAGAVGALLEQVQQDPALSRQILQLLLSNALNIA